MQPREVDGIAGLEAIVGVELGPSEPLTIDAEKVNAFADVTGDHQWIHVDAQRAHKESPWGGPIVHGYLVVSLVPIMLFSRLIRVTNVPATINYGIDKLRFPDVARVGAAVTLKATLRELTERKTGRLGRFALEFTAEGSDKPCCVAEILVLFTA
jgi:acyl dehydratase